MAKKILKLQSAMEYLMTYGWAILIIAVVLGVLFELGFFNSANLAPKVTAGSCQVYRPQGSGTTSFISLEGTCNNELPQYVLSFNGLGVDEITTGTTGLPLGSAPRSIFAWVYFSGSTPSGTYGVYSYGTRANSEDAMLAITTGGALYFFGYNNEAQSSLTVVPNNWNFIGYTYSGGSTVNFYLNGQSQTGLSIGGVLSTQFGALGSSQIGCDSYLPHCIGNSPFNGMIANIQVYNASLTSNEITSLYQEGLGGVPVKLNNLVAWWPLNGNLNDYSGNLNNGIGAGGGGIIFTSSWTAGYTAP